jgi:hypothetical protein
MDSLKGSRGKAAIHLRSIGSALRSGNYDVSPVNGCATAAAERRRVREHAGTGFPFRTASDAREIALVEVTRDKRRQHTPLPNR